MPIYRCSVTGSALAVSKEKGTPSVALAFLALFDTANPNEPLTPQDPPKLYTNLWLTDKTIDRTVETLRQTLGWQGEDFAELNDANPLLGVEVDIVWEWESYQDAGGQDKWRARVDWINQPGAGGTKKLDPQEAARVAAQFNRLLRPTPRAQGSAPRSAAPQAGVAQQRPQAGQQPPQQGFGVNAPATGRAPAAGGRAPAAGARGPAAGRQAPPQGLEGFEPPATVTFEDDLPY